MQTETTSENAICLSEYLLYLGSKKASRRTRSRVTNGTANSNDGRIDSKYDLTKITRRDLAEFLIDLSSEKLSPTSVNRIISAIRGFYKFLQFDRHIEKNPAEDSEAQRTTPTFRTS
ncbi:MAG: site-specific integrase [Acidobacteria bacterium]|nr:site-specific integrase [Acidobacteriota bacterium]